MTVNLSRPEVSRKSIKPIVIASAAITTVVLLALFIRRSDPDWDTVLNYAALGLLIFVVITMFYGIIAIHDVPYEIAKARNHPHQDAIHAAGWVSLFTLHALWPFLWIWAMVYRPDRGWGFKYMDNNASLYFDQIDHLTRRVSALEMRQRLHDMDESSSSSYSRPER